MEVTLRTPGALDALGAIAARHPEVALGAGTVLGADQMSAAAAAGCSFAVSPGATPAVLAAALGVVWLRRSELPGRGA